MDDRIQLDGLTCEEALDRLYECLDRELSPDEEALMRRHLAVCKECARQFAFEERLLAAIRQKCRMSPAPAGLERKIEQILSRL